MLALGRPGGAAVRPERAEVGNAGERGAEFEEVVRAAERAAELTRQLLAFSRRRPVEPTIVDLNAAIADMERMLRRIVGEDVEVVSRLGAVCPVLSDVTQIQQILLNLSANARDAMPTGGTLT